MKELVLLSWRNIWRNPLRSWILISSIMLGLWSGLFMIAFYQGMTDESIRKGIEEVSHLQIHAKGFLEEKDARLSLPNADALVKDLSEKWETLNPSSGDKGQANGANGANGVHWAIRSLARGMLSTARANLGVEIRGIDMEQEGNTCRLPQKLDSASVLKKRPSHPLWMSHRMADKHGFVLGHKVILTFQDSAGDLASGAFRIAGLFKTDNARLDEGTVFVPREQLNPLLGIGPHSAHEIALSLQNPEGLATVQAGLTSRLPNLDIRNWMELAPDLRLMQATLSQTLMVFMVIIMLGLAFGIVNTMLMAVLDRTREIGMLMALGMRKSRIFWMIVSETIWLVMAGTPMGFALTALTVTWLGKTGINLGFWSEGLAEFGMSTLVYPHLKGSDYGQVMLLVAATAFIGALYPARKALKLKPVEAIRSN